ncbi:hypothetical protein SVIOM342S_08883 [Streptomyces violaceorubidus]
MPRPSFSAAAARADLGPRTAAPLRTLPPLSRRSHAGIHPTATVAAARSPSVPAARAPEGLSHAALWTSAAHAAEALRPAPYVLNPWAADFLHAARSRAVQGRETERCSACCPTGRWCAPRFFDDYLLTAARSGSVRWSSSGRPGHPRLPAGLADRCARLRGRAPLRPRLQGPRAGLQPAHLRTPQHRRSRSLRHRVVGARGSSRRVSIPSRPTAWLCEAPLYFLGPDQVAAVVTADDRTVRRGQHLRRRVVNSRAVDSPPLQVARSSMPSPRSARPGTGSWPTRRSGGRSTAGTRGSPICSPCRTRWNGCPCTCRWSVRPPPSAPSSRRERCAARAEPPVHEAPGGCPGPRRGPRGNRARVSLVPAPAAPRATGRGVRRRCGAPRRAPRSGTRCHAGWSA